jgi:hypothetical protein
MHAPFDRSGQTRKRIPESRDRFPNGSGFWIVPILIAVALITLAIVQPKTSGWVSDAVQAEFIGNSGIADAPTQLAQPAGEPHSMTADWMMRQTADRGQR